MTVSKALANVGTRSAERRRGSWPWAMLRGVLERPFAGHGEGDDGIAPEADAGGLAVDADALRPAFGEAPARGRADQKAQAETAAPVAVAAGDVDGSDEGCGEHRGSFLHVPLLVRLRELFEMECADVTRHGSKPLWFIIKLNNLWSCPETSLNPRFGVGPPRAPGAGKRTRSAEAQAASENFAQLCRWDLLKNAGAATRYAIFLRYQSR